jgi:hypothetical protein
MLSVSLTLVVQGLLYKYAFEHVTWATVYFWSTLSTGVVVLFTFLGWGKWTDLVQVFKDKKVAAIMLLNNLFNTTAEALAVLAISLLPLTVAKGVSSAHALTVLGLGYVISRYYPQAVNKEHKEQFTYTTLLLYVLMIIGVIMVTVV